MVKDWLDKDIDRTLARGRRRSLSEPRAARARYHRRTGRVAVDLTNGCSFVFPARSHQGLARASDAELAAVEVLGSGYRLHWPALDTDFTVPGLLMGVFGTPPGWSRSWHAEPAKRDCPPRPPPGRANGRKGGRPRSPR